MTIAVEAPRGGIVEEFDGASRVLILRTGDIERFEDKHRGIFDVWDGFYGRGTKPNSTEVRDIVALGLVGGGMKPEAADAIVGNQGPDRLLELLAIAQAVVGIAFIPDIEDDKKKTVKPPPKD